MYKFNDNVRITTGFYKGLAGRLVEVNSEDPNCYKEYVVKVLTYEPSIFIIVPEQYLQKI